MTGDADVNITEGPDINLKSPIYVPEGAEIFLTLATVASSFSGFLPAKCSRSCDPPKFSTVSCESSDMDERRDRRPANDASRDSAQFDGRPAAVMFISNAVWENVRNIITISNQVRSNVTLIKFTAYWTG